MTDIGPISNGAFPLLTVKRKAPAKRTPAVPKLPEKPVTDLKKVAALRRTLLQRKTRHRPIRCLPHIPYWPHWSEIC